MSRQRGNGGVPAQDSLDRQSGGIHCASTQLRINYQSKLSLKLSKLSAVHGSRCNVGIMPETGDDRETVQRSIDSLAIAITVRSIPRILQPLLTTDLTIQQLKVLSVVVTAENGATSGGLVGTFGVSMASMSKLVDRLVAAGLTTRSFDPDDQRVRRIYATNLGRSVVRELMAARPELGGDVLAGLTVSELRALETGLRAVSRELRNPRG